MFEKLVPGDRVMKIPASSDDSINDDMKAPFGASAVVIVGEKTMLTESLDTGQQYTKYGCIIKYDNECYDSPTLDGEWFRVREGLMKISPDEKLIEDERIVSINYQIEAAKQREAALFNKQPLQKSVDNHK